MTTETRDPNGWVKFGLRMVKLCLMFYAVLFLLLLVEMLAWIRRGIDRVV